VFAASNGQDGGLLLEGKPDSDPLLFLPQVTSDEQGRFQFTGLRSGTYTVTAQRRGFAPQQYGARAPRRPGARLTIVAGQPAQNIVVTLVPTGVISGRVTDEAGEPIARMAVVIQRFAYGADGRRTLEVAGTTHTDDRGEYRAYWITPGRYYVLVAPLRSGSQEIAGAGYPATYYPGVADQPSATAIDVAPGSEVNAIDVSVSRQPVVRVRGRLPDTGELTPDLVWLCSNGNNHEGTVSSGFFEIRNVVPGSYSIHASAGEVMLLKGTVDVSDADVLNVVLTSDHRSSIEGRVTWEGTRLPSASVRERVWLTLDPVATSCSSDERSATVGADGSLRFVNVAAGDYRLRATLPSGTYLESARLNGIDALNGFSISGAVTASFDIVLSEKAGRIEGMVVGKDGRPMPGIEAVLLPIRETDRTPGRVMAAMSDQHGRFDLQSIPPGDYKLFAWEDLEPYGYYDADFVRPYMTVGTSIRVSENSRHSLRLESIPPR
jgi:protocatechuate 3,4-dioxygenase beta subunit